MNKIIILGAGGHSKVLIETILACNKNYEIALLDDKFSEKNHSKVLDYPIIGELKKIFDGCFKKKYNKAIVAIGDSKLRMKWFKNLIDYGYEVPSFIHPTCYLSQSSSIGRGTVIFARAVVQSNVKFGDGVIINSGSIVEHDGDIGFGTHICPGVTIAGNVKIGNSSWIGIGSTLKENLVIGSNVMVGAGSVVIENVSNNSIVFGVPAKKKI